MKPGRVEDALMEEVANFAGQQARHTKVAAISWAVAQALTERS
jgi:hypothetical protein